MIVAAWTMAALGVGLSAIRWLRVAQREHYVPGTVTRFARRWWNTGLLNRFLAMVGLGALVIAFFYPNVALLAAVVPCFGPLGLGIRGRTAPLRWTKRMRRLAAGLVGLTLMFVLVVSLADRAVVALAAAALLTPVLADLSLAAMAPFERRLSAGFVEQATRTLARIAPTIVAITGSYGKTTTKAYLLRLLQDSRSTVASPASFNNRMGLARAINEHLAEGTEVFIAEMGTYGKGEIADLCTWIEPTVGVITAIGPVHLERMGSLDGILEAKAEILEKARTAVLNVDDARLALLADQLDQEVIRCSAADATADVFIDIRGDGGVFVKGLRVGALADASVIPGNLGCALGAAVALGMPMTGVARALDDLPVAEHRQTVSTSNLGFTIVDDTYNSNPVGARAALATLERLGTGGRRVLVTPGMVELGAGQFEENVALTVEAMHQVTDLVIVGRTNRVALQQGTVGGEASVIVVDSREDAVNWVRANLGDGDVVLYENDLPDHYP